MLDALPDAQVLAAPATFWCLAIMSTWCMQLIQLCSAPASACTYLQGRVQPFLPCKAGWLLPGTNHWYTHNYLQAMYEEQAAAVEAATADLERQRLANESLRERAAALEK